MQSHLDTWTEPTVTVGAVDGRVANVAPTDEGAWRVGATLLTVVAVQTLVDVCTETMSSGIACTCTINCQTDRQRQSSRETDRETENDKERNRHNDR